MTQKSTYYDVLQVARDASPEVIRAAYRALAQRCHPDRHPNDPRATRLMALLNAAYAVLASPDARSRYDRQIAVENSATSNIGRPASPTQPSRPPTAQGPRAAPVKRANAGTRDAIIRWATVPGLYIVLWFVAASIESEPPRPIPAPYVQPRPAAPAALPAARANEWVRPDTAPNGLPWPEKAGYLSGFPRLRALGLSRLTIDNSQNGSDVFVKLVALQSDASRPVRHVFIPAGKSFTLGSITPGSYDVRFRDLRFGALSRSEPFTLEQIEKSDGTEYSVMSLTLYTMRGGNTQMHQLSEIDF